MTFNFDRLFRIIAVFIAIYAMVTIGRNIIFAFSIYFNTDSELVPRELIYYPIFPLVFIIPVFGFSLWYSSKSLLSEITNKPLLLILLIIALFNFFYPEMVFDGIYKFNPFGL
ncbi:hypothetical protein [Olleya sp. Bg11-27]|uniref:hypothetical protein n=1 Tax=Olleya sp. Bg11-27 TaxID=2058135 RepID=UPI000C317FD9|nr:hypothetical protein [Olleya sp. Bg11-27]AUC75727.1 hypothetical protein CW732_08590 [Olleya sp. Bg11-27]